MAQDARSHQKKVERRKAKVKSKHQALKLRDQRAEAQTLLAIQTAPILHCIVHEEIFGHGMGTLVISRELPNNRVVFANILLDLFCLGVKIAMFEVVGRLAYESDVYDRLTKNFPMIPMEPACARKLVEGAIEYARELGFPPHSDYREAKVIFGDIDTKACGQTFEYGRNGKPFYISGPNDSSSRINQILRTLSERKGSDGFHVTVPLGAMETVGPGRIILPDPESDTTE